MRCVRLGKRSDVPLSEVNEDRIANKRRQW